jgi:branched-chain amino acid transport system permease protein
VSALSEFLRRIEQGVEVASLDFTAPQGFQQIALAAFLILILVFRPSGLTGGREFRWSFDRQAGPRPQRIPTDARAATDPTNDDS